MSRVAKFDLRLTNFGITKSLIGYRVIKKSQITTNLFGTNSYQK